MGAREHYIRLGIRLGQEAAVGTKPESGKSATNAEPMVDLDDDDIKALVVLSGDVGHRYRAKEVAAALSVTDQRAQYRLDRLVKTGDAVRQIISRMQVEHGYEITPKGRDTLVRRGLL
jgi:RIO-like serine/threonine protein kinase